MPREYKHIQQYEKEIFELKAQGKTNREISEKLGYSLEQVKGLIKRHNKKQQKVTERNKTSILYFPLSEQPRKKRRSPQRCNSTVTKAFNIPHTDILS